MSASPADSNRRIAELEKRVKELEARVEALLEGIKERDERIRALENENKALFRRVYGPKSDRPSDEAQTLLQEIFLESLSEETARIDEDSSNADEASVATRKTRRHKPTGRRPLPEHLERRVEECDLPEEDKKDPITGKELKFIGWEERERLCEEPARLYVQVLKRAKYERPVHHEGDERSGVITAPEPLEHGNPIERCKADVSLLASVIVMKYLFHLPLYRLQEYYWGLGRVWLARSTLCGWVIGCARALEPIYHEMKRRLLASGYVGMDDTPVRLLDPGNGKTATVRFWSYVGLSGTEELAPYTLYDFRLTREKEGPLNFLGEAYEGYVQADAYAGHNALMEREGIIEIGCWDHGHRYFTNASAEDPASAAEALLWIKKLYKVEEEAIGMTAEERGELRSAKAAPILEAFKEWLDERTESYLPKSGMASAVRYCQNQWEALSAYVTHGRVPISNCLCEQSFKAIATGRNNWLFLGSEEGGKAAAILYSLTMTCRRMGLDARVYLMEVMRVVNAYPCSRIAELLPEQWKARQEAEGKVVTPHRDDFAEQRVSRPTIRRI